MAVNWTQFRNKIDPYFSETSKSSNPARFDAAGGGSVNSQADWSKNIPNANLSIWNKSTPSQKYPLIDARFGALDSEIKVKD